MRIPIRKSRRDYLTALDADYHFPSVLSADLQVPGVNETVDPRFGEWRDAYGESLRAFDLHADTLDALGIVAPGRHIV